MLSYKKALVALLLFAVLPLSVSSATEGAGGKKRPQKPITITSDTMEADRADRLVVFKGDVVAREDFTLFSDELYVHYNNADEIREIIARGNVKIVQGDRTATADRAVYDRKKRTIVLTGHPVVVRCGDRVSGDRITVYVDDENAFVEGRDGGRVKAVIMPEKKCAPEKGPESAK